MGRASRRVRSSSFPARSRDSPCDWGHSGSETVFTGLSLCQLPGDSRPHPGDQPETAAQTRRWPRATFRRTGQLLGASHVGTGRPNVLIRDLRGDLVLAVFCPASGAGGKPSQATSSAVTPERAATPMYLTRCPTSLTRCSSRTSSKLVVRFVHRVVVRSVRTWCVVTMRPSRRVRQRVSGIPRLVPKQSRSIPRRSDVIHRFTHRLMRCR
jgi:hypothetical protein